MYKLFSVLAALSFAPFIGHAAPTGSVSSDGEIIEVLKTLDEGEIDAGKLESKHGTSDAVKAFAENMISQHTKNESEGKRVAKQNSLDPKSSDLSKSLKSDAKDQNKSLKKSAAAEFDKNYVDEQIKMHEGALKLIDEKLLPKAENVALKAFITTTRMAVVEHLEHAKTLAAKL